MARNSGGGHRRAQSSSRPQEGRPKWYWWRSEPEGRSRALEEFEDLPVQARAGLAVKIQRFLNGESRSKEVDYLVDEIYEIRHRVSNNPYRVLFFRWGQHYVGLTAFYKNQRKTSKQDLDRAKKRIMIWKDAFGREPSD
jgi:phage-related protein